MILSRSFIPLTLLKPVFFVESVIGLVPTSMSAAPGLSHDPLISCAWPAAAITMSACLTISSMFYISIRAEACKGCQSQTSILVHVLEVMKGIGAPAGGGDEGDQSTSRRALEPIRQLKHTSANILKLVSDPSWSTWAWPHLGP